VSWCLHITKFELEFFSVFNTTTAISGGPARTKTKNEKIHYCLLAWERDRDRERGRNRAHNNNNNHHHHDKTIKNTPKIGLFQREARQSSNGQRWRAPRSTLSVQSLVLHVQIIIIVVPVNVQI
jgi:hypothetical protein